MTWVDTFTPTQEELEEITEKYKIDAFVKKDALSPTPYLYINEYKDSLYSVFHFPVFRMSHKDESRQELDIVLKKDFLMTIRYDSIEPLEVLHKKLEANESLSRNEDEEIPAPVLANLILREIYLGVIDDLASFSDWLRDIEDRIYHGKEKEMVVEISLASRELTEFRSSVHEHEHQLSLYQEIGSRLFGEEFEESFEDVVRAFEQLSSQTEFLTDLVRELRETNNSLVSTKQNEVMKVLTILAFITFPLSLIASIFGMNTSHMPIIGGENDFWVVMIIMGFSTICMFVYFKYKKWI